MDEIRDAYGAELMAIYRGDESVYEIVERDDRFIDASPWPKRYFGDYRTWTAREKQAISFVTGRVLDIGCGAGRHGLYLQGKKFDVTGIDNSPGAIRVCRMRGYKRVKVMSLDKVHTFPSNAFDTVIMMGNNFGLLGGLQRGKRLLKQLYRITSPNGQIIAEAVDPYRTKDPVHLDYHRLNRKRGRMSGQLRIRVRHRKIIGEWFDLLLVSAAQMKTIVEGTGWHVAEIIGDKGPGYTARLAK